MMCVNRKERYDEGSIAIYQLLFVLRTQKESLYYDADQQPLSACHASRLSEIFTRDRERESIMKFHYKFVPATAAADEALFNQMGAAKYEYCGLSVGNQYYIFKRAA